MYLDFEGLTDKELWVSHEVMRFKSSWRAPQQEEEERGWRRRMSSAKRNSLARDERERAPTSLIKIRNRMGPSIDP